MFKQMTTEESYTIVRHTQGFPFDSFNESLKFPIEDPNDKMFLKSLSERIYKWGKIFTMI